jgi:hypothetical protein
MYTVCTFRLAHAIDAPYLLVIPRVFLWIALAAWMLASIGLVLAVVRAAPTASGSAASR